MTHLQGRVAGGVGYHWIYHKITQFSHGGLVVRTTSRTMILRVGSMAALM